MFEVINSKDKLFIKWLVWNQQKLIILLKLEIYSYKVTPTSVYWDIADSLLIVFKSVHFNMIKQFFIYKIMNAKVMLN